MTTLSEFIAEHKITATVSSAPTNPDWPNSNAWKVTLHYGDSIYVTPFHTGSAIKGEPSATDVLNCLISDAMGAENALSFEEWASDMGFNEDSRKAFKIFEACSATAINLRAFLGDAFDTFVEAEQE